MNTETRSSQVIFFLGAGASVAAGVPTTYDFVDQFIDHLGISDPGRRSKIKEIVDILNCWRPTTRVDIELLLETLTKLKDKDSEPMLQFCINGNLKLEGDFEDLIKDLKDFIKSKTMVQAEMIDYLRDLRGFIIDAKNRANPTPLDIISLNYDTCIEQFCNIHEMSYQDGFDIYWNLKTFDRDDADIRLYKLHGSILWYQSDRGNFIKLPIMSNDSKIQLFSREYAENLMLYPMQKWDYAEPLLELMVRIKGLLQSRIYDPNGESESLKFLIAVGYSFRDDHIKKIVWDAARRNTKLYVIIVDPNAYQIYHDRVEYYDNEGEIPSHLKGRVICLPYKFEKILPHIRNHYLANLKEGIRIRDDLQKNEDIYGHASWIDCFKPLLNAEYCEMLLNITENKAIKDSMNLYQYLELTIKIGVNLLLNKQKEKAGVLFKESYETINEIIEKNFIDNIRFDLSLINDPAYFNLNRGEISKFEVLLRDICGFCTMRYELYDEPKGYESDRLNRFITMCKEFIDYIKLLYDVSRINVPVAYADKSSPIHTKYNSFNNSLTSQEERKILKMELESEIREAEIGKIKKFFDKYF